MTISTNRVRWFALFLMVLLSGNGFAAFMPEAEQSVKGTPVYRFWSERFKHQFLTINQSVSGADFRVTRGHDWKEHPVDIRITHAYKDAIRAYCK